MEIKRVKIGDLNPASYNPRIDLQPGDLEYEKLRMSIEEFDCVEPLVWNKRTGNLVGGHQRLKILIARGDKEVEVSVVNLDEAKEKALNLALNKIQGDWDFPKLADVLMELDTGDFDLNLTGFDLEEREEIATWVPGANLRGGNGPADERELDENIETDYECPSCSYKWSGKPK